MSLTFSLFQLLLFQVISFPPNDEYTGHDLPGILWMLFTGVYLGVSIARLFLRKIRFCFCAQALEGETAESKAAYKQHRWEMRRKRRVPGRHMSEGPAQKHLCLKNAFWRADSGPHSVPVRNSSCIPSENTEKTKVNLAAAQQHHCSGLLYSPYLMADPSRPLMAWRPHPPSGCHLGLQTPTHKSRLAPLPPLANDFLSVYTTPPECLLAPLPASTDDEFSRPQTPAHETPPECLLTPLPASTDDDLYATPPECLLTPLPDSTDDDLYATPPECLLTPLPDSTDDDLYATPPECLLTPLPASTDDDLYATPPECLLTPLPASTDDDHVASETLTSTSKGTT
ncbi:nuclear pore complex-interacting protein family member B12-like [Aotus nancymaae]|uniref:nuclear pore complex-interacting protein family member B12-like n=1 Tax=Aotus nancymaae TaxID=37293 RepID=UPI0030FF0E19